MSTWTLAHDQSGVCYVPFGHVVDHMTGQRLAYKKMVHEHNGYIESIMFRTRKYNNVILRAWEHSI